MYAWFGVFYVTIYLYTQIFLVKFYMINRVLAMLFTHCDKSNNCFCNFVFHFACCNLEHVSVQKG